jgi:hypothetical protein
VVVGVSLAVVVGVSLAVGVSPVAGCVLDPAVL